MSEKIFDITQTLREGLPVWPGDPEFRRHSVCRLEDGSAFNLSEIRMGTHTGTHLDAPLHIITDGAGVESFSLATLIGPARVFEFPIAVTEDTRCISATDLALLDLKGVKRVIFKTSPPEPVGGDHHGHVFLGEDAAAYLVKLGVLLVGIDTVSVDPGGTGELRAHHLLLKHGVAILENLQLVEVSQGDYELICLPLKIEGTDGVPVRAVLRTHVVLQT